MTPSLPFRWSGRLERTEKEREGGRDRESSVCVCVCVFAELHRRVFKLRKLPPLISTTKVSSTPITLKPSWILSGNGPFNLKASSRNKVLYNNTSSCPPPPPLPPSITTPLLSNVYTCTCTCTCN